MHKAERPTNFFPNTFTQNQTEQIRKGVICFSFFFTNTPYLNTVKSTFKVEQLHLLICIVTVKYGRCYIGIPAYPSI